MRGRLLIDTNLLVLLTVGTASRAFIAAHKRTMAYGADDFELLTTLVAEAESLVTTPHILSETSNLVRQFRMPGRALILDALRDFIVSVGEIQVPAAEAALRPEFRSLGLADSAAIAAQARDLTLLTDDLDLYVASLALGHEPVNFTHERRSRLG